ncbi:MAG: hypothetical protein ABIR66_04590 [Saprospiraceae bacterium]
MKITILGFAASILFAAIISKQTLSTIYLYDHDISITLSENDSDMTIKAKFPSSKSSLVEVLLVNHFKLNENLDLRSTKISMDKNSEQDIHFQIQSKPGSLNMVMIKRDNPSTALLQFKAFTERLKSGLTK